jgi:tRNA nucleotidyltransferase/poly(A) polymerase
VNSYLARTDAFVASLGLEAYRVGGSVRDELIGRKVKDADYVVRAPMRELREALSQTDANISPIKLRDGRHVGYRAAQRGLGLIEMVLPRKEVSTGPGHGDFEIVVDHEISLDEDAERRDFTFNALYFAVGDDSEDVLDPTGGGLYDLQHKRIQVTHEDSFRDDPVRMLRALRFISTLDYELAPPTRWLMARDAGAAANLVGVKGGASAAAFEELCKLLMGQCPAKALREARDTGVLAYFLPELADMIGFDQVSRYHDMTTDEHTFMALETAAHVDAPLRVRMALLFHDSGKPETAWIGKDGRKHYYARKVKYNECPPLYVETEDHEVVGARLWKSAAKRLGAGKHITDDVFTLIRNHMVQCEKIKPTTVRRERVRLGDDMLRDLYLMRACDLSGKGCGGNVRFLGNIRHMEHARIEAAEAGVPASTKELAIDGRDAVEAGLVGPAIGQALRRVLDEVVCQPDELRMSREWQLSALTRKA